MFTARGPKYKLKGFIKLTKDLITIQSKILTANSEKLFVIEGSNLNVEKSIYFF